MYIYIYIKLYNEQYTTMSSNNTEVNGKSKKEKNDTHTQTQTQTAAASHLKRKKLPRQGLSSAVSSQQNVAASGGGLSQLSSIFSKFENTEGTGTSEVSIPAHKAEHKADGDAEILQMLGKLSSKSAETRIKSLITLKQHIATRFNINFQTCDVPVGDGDTGILAPLLETLASLCFMYNKLVLYENDKRVRYEINVLLCGILVKVKKHIRPHLKTCVPYIWCSINDVEAEVANMSKQLLTNMFPNNTDERIISLFLHLRLAGLNRLI